MLPGLLVAYCAVFDARRGLAGWAGALRLGLPARARRTLARLVAGYHANSVLVALSFACCAQLCCAVSGIHGAYDPTP